MSPNDIQTPPAKSRQYAGALAAGILGVLCYTSSLVNDFTYDDNAIVRNNPRIRSLANLREIWLTDWWYGPTEQEPLADPARDRLYRPLTLFSFALNHAVHQLRPFGYHALNVLLHAGVCMLVWSFGRRLFRDDAIATVAALLFAVHPVHAEAVAGVVGRGEILAASFMLLGWAVLLPDNKPTDLKHAWLAAPLFLAALLSKETAICFPAVALLTLHAAHHDPRPPARWWLQHAAILALPLLVYLPLRFHALGGHLLRTQPNALLFNPLHDADLAGRLHGPFTVLGHYTRLLFLPNRLCCDYGLAAFDPRAGVGLMTLIGLIATIGLIIALFGYRRATGVWRWLAVTSTIFLASYALISNTVLLIGVSLAERLMYWPSVPALLGVAAATVTLWRKHCAPAGVLHQRRALLRICGVLLLAALGLRGFLRSSDWADNARLFTTDLRTQPRSAHLNNAVARVFIEHAKQGIQAGDQTERDRWLHDAERRLHCALDILSRYPEALKNLGYVYLLRGNQELALRYFESTLRLNPADRGAQRLAAHLRGETPQSTARAAELQQAVEQDPADPDVRVELARSLIALGRNYEALQQYREAAQLAPDNVAALRGYGEALALNKLLDEALNTFRRVLELDPADWQTHANMATLLADRDAAGALHHAQIAFDLQSNNLQTQLGLAEALALNGQIPEALQRLRRIDRALPPDDPFRRLVADRIVELEGSQP